MLWQSTMIALARSPIAKRLVESFLAKPKVVRRFVGGCDASEAAATSAGLASGGIRSSLYYLGEYVRDGALIEANVQGLLSVVPLAAGAPDLHLSVDPTQIGAIRSWELCRENAIRIGERLRQCAAGRPVYLMLDMEDYTVCARTIELYYSLASAQLPAALTVQAYLHRTCEDLRTIVAMGVWFGSSKELSLIAASAAAAHHAEIESRYIDCARQLLSPESRRAGTRPVFGTHNPALLNAMIQLADNAGWARSEWEAEILLGVSPALEQELVDMGVTLRLYLPFGRDWWPYVARRIGENPHNLFFAFRACGPLGKTGWIVSR